ncbi:hypothetical protein ACFL38_05455 [Candidatus Omnitrophota bacterium]
MASSFNEKSIQPRKIRIDASTVCQLRCPSCPTASGETGERLGSGFLKFKDFKSLIDKNPQVSSIELSNWGEIFLNKELIEIMRYAYKHNVALHANNGANLNAVGQETLNALVKYRFRTLSVSLDGASQGTYSQYRIRGNFDQVIDNIRIINAAKYRYKTRYPLLNWQFVPFGHNEHEISKAREMAKELNMSFHVKLSWENLYDKTFSPIKNRELIRKETGLGVATRGEYRKKYKEEYVLRYCCLKMWTDPQINYDGRLLGCSMNYWGDYGNVFENGLEHCFNSEKINYARAMLLGKQMSKKDIPCTQCKVYKSIAKHKNWFAEDDFEDEPTKSRIFIMIENKVLRNERLYQLAKQIVLFKRRVWQGLCVRVRRIYSFISPGKIKSRVYPLKIPLPPDAGKGWKPVPIFTVFPKGLQELAAHASVLAPQYCPHPPHAHKEEELLLLLAGEINLMIPDKKAGDKIQRIHLKPGQLAYYPSDFSHTLETTSAVPANYIMFKWDAGFKRSNATLMFNHYNMFDSQEDSDVKDGFCARVLFEGRTNYLKKLQCHTSTLAPGAGYDPHIDTYDVALVMLEGEVETLGVRVKPHSVIYYAAGEPHGMRNPGKKVAKYIVFEFHSR